MEASMPAYPAPGSSQRRIDIGLMVGTYRSIGV
jgi:hypothetical protein